ncbi:Malonyl-CoA-acyl carrier protein transacylase, mitochondrial [Toxocara canis]|uniref:Malonyl-CoA-acyl carrier protein transacylase, mitochondrial n=1 Tax=Toxocara canis TaxID=6265 RepID=A0A0B2V2C9_TOXCA|nr:Malonyl-CoA-acyl carrier protein transacylase, mitochondrial [Toxocara canis]
MRRLWYPTAIIKRSLRSKHPSIKKPVEWLQKSTTYVDAHTAVLDPYTSSPYPEEDVYELLKSGNSISAQEHTKWANEKHKKRKLVQLNFDHIPIEEHIVVLFPGQGSQHVGMGSKLEDCSAASELYDEASEFLGYDLKKLCLEGPKTKLEQTIYCQPAVFVSSLAALEKAKILKGSFLDRVTDTAGFSVGEYAALVLAGVISFQNALRLVDTRAKLMHECNQRIASGMITIRVSAASRLEEAMVAARELATEKGELPICEVANYLFRGVKVVGASATCLRFLVENQERFAFQVIKKLAVSGAFHTRLMDAAIEPMRKALKGVPLTAPRVNVYSNYTGKTYGRKLTEIRDAIVNQIASPVKWEQILQLLYRKHQVSFSSETLPSYVSTRLAEDTVC